ncbi:hypothetical protein KSC_071290 [Ktedonobacter sp. SOSP1-52]|nr:hypothetical protein KSC_035170 [Ktedonobacter sp. SOSP1-52]GHO68237.1 hypothetical protein KSC_071290 [Ktedonobacter sp. SOSP1-52]
MGEASDAKLRRKQKFLKPLREKDATYCQPYENHCSRCSTEEDTVKPLQNLHILS